MTRPHARRTRRHVIWSCRIVRAAAGTAKAYPRVAWPYSAREAAASTARSARLGRSSANRQLARRSLIIPRIDCVLRHRAMALGYEMMSYRPDLKAQVARLQTHLWSPDL